MAHAVDIHVGKRLRHRRWMIGMTQGELADAVGIRFQQVQKYEAGTNRISASRLWDISQAVDVAIEYFFDGLGGGGPGALTDANDEADKLARMVAAMPEPQRRRLHDLAQDLSTHGGSAV